LAGQRTEEAVTLGRKAAQAAGEHHRPAAQARAEAVVAEALLARGEAGEARAAAKQAWTRVDSSQYRLIRIRAGIVLARATGDAHGLAPLVAEARARHAYELELEGRLAADEMTRNTAQLAALRTEAFSRGFRYMARRESGLR
jgi:hypothetical protein